MENMYEFAQAAFPWIAMGLMLAITCAMAARQKKQGAPEDYGVVGMCVGAAVGANLGPMFNQLAVGVPLGLLFGFAIGMCFKKPVDDSRESESVPE